MLVNFWYVSNILQDNCINIYQLADEFGDSPLFMKLEGGTYIFCISVKVNIEKICNHFGYAIQGNPIVVLIDSDNYNRNYKVSKTFTLVRCEE